MARIVHICNTLQKRKYLSLCTDSSLLTVIIVTYVWNTTSTHSGTFQSGRLHTEPDTVKNRLFSFFLLSFSMGNSILATSFHLHINPLHFLARSALYHSKKKIVPSPKRHFFSESFCIECMYNAILLHNTHAQMTTLFLIKHRCLDT